MQTNNSKLKDMSETVNNLKIKKLDKSRKELMFNSLAAAMTTCMCVGSASLVGIFNPVDCVRIRWQVAEK
eukprot:Pgem_evm1s11664